MKGEKLVEGKKNIGALASYERRAVDGLKVTDAWQSGLRETLNQRARKLE